MASLLQEIRYALRMWRKSPGPALAAVLTLALGIGANTAIFTLANASMWKPIPLLDVKNITMALERAPQDGSSVAPVQVGWESVTPGNYLDWRQQAAAFEKLTACKYASFNIGATGGDPERVFGSRAAADYLGVFGVRPALGRWFTEEEDRPGHDSVIVLGYGIWQRRFGGAAEVLGSTMVVEGRSRTVIGVMPKDFNFPLGSREHAKDHRPNGVARVLRVQWPRFWVDTRGCHSSRVGSAHQRNIECAGVQGDDRAERFSEGAGSSSRTSGPY
ncbi:exported hypothetical protein [Candidatus Sulfopaludibacter sp. SbA4]|nr:exported hypothetical protein [Candidatus Sulfopaludibacter sp. SbA4]